MFVEGLVWVKLVEVCGGFGQYVVYDFDELDVWFGGLEECQLVQGLVLEVNLESIVIYSVGQFWVNGFLLSYYGYQYQICNVCGELVYVGFDLLVVCGGYVELLVLDLVCEVCQVIEYVWIFDIVVVIFFFGCFVLWCNYDIVQGWDGNGWECFGVFEQFWWVGGVSSVEIVVLEVFCVDLGLFVVCVVLFEIYEDKCLLDNSWVIYCGFDEYGDFLFKYVMMGEV